MKLQVVLVTVFSLGFSSSLWAQEQGGQQKMDPIKMLTEIQEKMANAENLLNRTAVGFSGDSKEIDETQKAIQRRLERLMEQGKSQDEIVDELNKFLERKKKQMERTGEQMTQAVQEIDKLLQSQQSQANCVQEIEQILKSQEQMEEALKSMDKMFQEVGNKHEEALGTIEKLIRMAEQSSHKSGQMMPQIGRAHV